MNRNESFFYHLLILFLFSLIIWSGTSTINFFNDDYQILGYLQDNYKDNPLDIFLSKDVSIYYYRPIPNLWNLMFLNVSGFSPEVFRISSLLLYLFLVFLLYLFLSRLLENNKIALFFTLCFSFLPSHDTFLVWIASAGDIFAAIFVILSIFFAIFKSSRVSVFFSFIFMCLAFLSKESSIPLILLLFFSAFLFKEKKHRLFLLAFAGFCFLILLFLFREKYLAIKFLNSPNIENFDFLTLFVNFFKYIFVVVLPTFAYSTQNPLGLILNFILLSVLLLRISIIFKEKEKVDWKIISFGFFWYALFVFPVLTLFMRWYSFLPSIGLLIIFSEIFKNAKKIVIYSTLVPLITIFVVVDSYSLHLWRNSVAFTQKVLSEISRIDTRGSNKALFWYFPQYYNNFPILRSGVEKAINFSSKIKFQEILLPVSIVYQRDSQIKFNMTKENVFQFNIENAIPYLNKRVEEIADTTQVENDYYRLKIVKIIGKKRYFAEVEFKRKKEDYVNFFFDGKEFNFFY